MGGLITTLTFIYLMKRSEAISDLFFTPSFSYKTKMHVTFGAKSAGLHSTELTAETFPVLTRIVVF